MTVSPATPEVPFGPLGWFVWKRTYAREGETRFEQTIDRCLDACETQLHCGFTKEEREEFRTLLLTLKGSLAGRFLWQLGTKTVDRLGLLSLQNCAAMLLDKPVSCYAWLFDALMLGVGVGFNLEQRTIRDIEQVRYCRIKHYHEPILGDELTAVRCDSSGDEWHTIEGERVYVVPDSREGWVRLLVLVLTQHFPVDGKLESSEAVETFHYNTVRVRPKGAPIKTFGGIASGPEMLVWGIGEINRILNGVSGERPSSVVLLDVANIIGHIVVSGNVRRCLDGETRVWTLQPDKESGRYETPNLKLRKIRDLEVGDLVWTHHKRWRPVTQKVWNGQANTYVLKTKRRADGEEGETFRMTAGHLLYVENYAGERKWLQASTLQAANVMRPGIYKLVCAPLTSSSSAPQTLEIESFEAPYYGIERPELLNTYDVSVQEDESFVVGERDCVVVHNSAQIAIGSPDDVAFLNAKRWDGAEVPPYWRCNSNNSVAAYHIRSLDDSFWDLYGGNSEPYGLVNLPLCRSAGQVGSETATPKVDPEVVCVNPCVEQPLCNKETCCLAEVYLPNCESEQQLRRIVYFLYRVCKHSLALPCHWAETQEIVRKNMRMGIGQSGYLEASEEQRCWLPSCASYLDRLDEEYSASHGWPRSIKLRTVKPSGTLSLLPGVTAGCHPAFAKFYLKRMRVSKEWGDEARLRGYHVEPVEYVVTDEDTGAPLTRYDERTLVVDFPVTHKESVVVASQMTALDQIKVMQRLQADWSDNAVSMTVYYSLSELAEVRRYLEQEFRTGIKGISFLLRQDHNFRQAPWTEISEQEYRKRVRDIVRPFGSDLDISKSHLGAADDDELAENSECSGGSCPRR